MTDLHTHIGQFVPRRSVLVGAADGLGAMTLGAVTPGVALGQGGSRRLDDPFTLGVASGDPAPDGSPDLGR